MSGILARLFRRPGAAETKWIEVDDLRHRLTRSASFVLIDVRGPDEFTAPPGHLPRAINIPLPELTSRLAEVLAYACPVVLVCKTDRRSAKAADLLLASGLRDVTVLRGGTEAWHQQGLNLE